MHPAAPPVLRPLGGLAAATSVMLGIAAVAWAWAVHVWAWTSYGTYARLFTSDGFAGAPGVSATGIGPMKSSSIGLGVAVLVSAVAAGLFIGWLVRARANVEPFGQHRHTAGWAVGGWFVPFANLAVPGRVVADVWRASAARSGQPAGTALVTAWWLTATSTWVLYVLVMTSRIEPTVPALHTAAVLVHGPGPADRRRGGARDRRRPAGHALAVTPAAVATRPPRRRGGAAARRSAGRPP
ncbi:DUF4328 domain-containing protein [Pseudonocardia sp. CA-107938]|uniref:DUF4328 domain-containing protein n=1 Tax=Pseudonocardia sp. CA-107938 TaxID=3240021 RepID=UPI003D900AA5